MQLGRLRALAAAAAGTLAWAGTAHAAVTDFATSFEATDPPPTWISTAERASGVTGPLPTGIPGNVTDTVVAVRASGENAGGGEVKENLVDGSPEPSGSCSRETGWVEFELAQPVAVVHYALTSANDARRARPARLDAPGLAGRQSWTDLDTQVGQTFGAALPDQGVSLRQPDRLSPLPAGHHAQRRRRPRCSWPSCSCRTASTAPPPAGRHAQPARHGPARRLHRQAGAGFTGLKALQYARQAHRRRPRLLVQQGLRRRHRGRAGDRAVVPDLPGLHPRTTCATRAPTSRSTWPSPTAPTSATWARRPARRAAQPARARAPRRRSTPTSGTKTAADRQGRRAARPSTGSSSATTAPPGRRRSAAGSTTSRSPAAPPGPRRVAPVRLRRHHAAAPTPAAASRAATTSATAVPHGFNFWTPGHQRRLAELDLRVPPGQQRREPARRCRRSPRATSPARGWATGRPSR